MDNPTLIKPFVQPQVDGASTTSFSSTMDPSNCAIPTTDSSANGQPSQSLLSLSHATMVSTSEFTLDLSGFALQSLPDSATGQPFYQLDLNFDTICYSTASLETPNYLYQSAESVASVGMYLSDPSTASLSSLDLSISGDLDLMGATVALLPETEDSTNKLSIESSETVVSQVVNGDYQPSQATLLTASVPDTVINSSLQVAVDFPSATGSGIPMRTSGTVEPWLPIDGCPAVDTSSASLRQGLFLASEVSTPMLAFQQQSQRARDSGARIEPSYHPTCNLSQPEQEYHPNQSFMLAPQIPTMGDPMDVHCTDALRARSYFQSPLPAVGTLGAPRGSPLPLHTRARSTSFGDISTSQVVTSGALSQRTMSFHGAHQSMAGGSQVRRVCSSTLIPPSSHGVSVFHAQHNQQLWPPHEILPSTLALNIPSIASVLSRDAPVLSSDFTIYATQAMDSPMSFEEMDGLSDHVELGGHSAPELSPAHVCSPDMVTRSPVYFPPPNLAAPYKRRQMTAYARWTIQEDRQLAEAVQAATHQLQMSSSSSLSSPPLDWFLVASMVPTRSPTQCHARWSKVLAEQRRARKMGSVATNNKRGASFDSFTTGSTDQLQHPLPPQPQGQQPLEHPPPPPKQNRSRSASSCSTMSTLRETLPHMLYPTFSSSTTPSSSLYSCSSSSSLSLATASTEVIAPETSPMLGVRRGRWTPEEDRELMALVDQYLAEQGHLVLLAPPPLPATLETEGEEDWSIQKVFYEVMALHNPDDPVERRARGLPDWFSGSLEEYERLVDATVANIPWNQLVLRMTPRPLTSTATGASAAAAATEMEGEEDGGDDDYTGDQRQHQIGLRHPILTPTTITTTKGPLGHRLGIQAQARWAEALDPRVRRGPWSAVEDALLERAVQECSKCWIKISEWMPGRTQRQCRTRWVQLTVKAERIEAKRRVHEQIVKTRGLRQSQLHQHQGKKKHKK
ncbi:hypothetical protein DFQ27_001761 [Actinomortierella ambigua]|uniref:Uncharacterized protein n=1 Tax=Actinomortierella ambigua TaxID=1343610 RepID=A0A9P6QDX1_9FUNG|nr:hypothetical protein DFQ27_001761 [Actinomortierella ambigua]